MIALLLSVFKAVPAIWSIYQMTVDLYIKQMNEQDESNVNNVREKREALIASLTQPGLSNENRDRIRRILYSLHKL